MTNRIKIQRERWAHLRPQFAVKSPRYGREKNPGWINILEKIIVPYGPVDLLNEELLSFLRNGHR